MPCQLLDLYAGALQLSEHAVQHNPLLEAQAVESRAGWARTTESRSVSAVPASSSESLKRPDERVVLLRELARGVEVGELFASGTNCHRRLVDPVHQLFGRLRLPDSREREVDAVSNATTDSWYFRTRTGLIVLRDSLPEYDGAYECRGRDCDHGADGRPRPPHRTRIASTSLSIRCSISRNLLTRMTDAARALR